MIMAEEDEPLQRQRVEAPNATGPYVLRPLIEGIPLATVADTETVRITCVELWGMSIWTDLQSTICISAAESHSG